MAYQKPPSTANVTARNRSPKATWQRVGGPAPQYDAQFRQAIGMGTPNYRPGSYNQQDYNQAASISRSNPNGLTMPGAPASPGGGGYGRGGGGGGGGSTLTQAMFDQMVAALARQGQPLQATQTNLPAFQGTNVAAFNPAMYNQAQQSLNQAVTADRANVNANAQNTTGALQSNFRNDYANQGVTPGATQAPVGANLQATAGGPPGNDANQQAAAGVNGANGDSQAAFTNLLAVLAANANQSQASRLNQVQMDRGTAQNAIGAQQLGLGAGINQARAGAQQQWSQQDQERRYQNSLMAQQWQRENMTRRQDLTNQTAQANWTQRNQQMQATLQPILDLIGATGGTGVNMATLQALLARR